VEGILYVLTLMLRYQVLGVLPLLGPDYTVIYLPAPCPLPVAPHDFSRSPELIDLGHSMASSFLQGLRIQGAGIYGHPHYHPVSGDVSASIAGRDPASPDQRLEKGLLVD
jgi:NTE family protein